MEQSLPELLEVDTVARRLRATLPGRRVLEVRQGKADFIDDPPAPATWALDEMVRSWAAAPATDATASDEPV